MAETYSAIVLAAGEGKRMKSNRPKVLCEVLFKPMLAWVLDALRESKVQDICCVAGFAHEQVEAFLAKRNAAPPARAPVHCVLQAQRRGTGHAVMMAQSFLQARRGGQVLVLNGDAPFLDAATINAALAQHTQNGNAATVISAAVEDPTGYGRIVRDPRTRGLRGIVEQKDADEQVQQIQEINSGAYWFEVDALLDILGRITSDNAQGEYYLTDAIKLLLESGRRVDACTASDAAVVLGANDCLQLNELNSLARSRVLRRHMRAGVSVPCTDGVVIGPDVQLGAHVCILPGTILRGCTCVGADCTLGPNAMLTDTRLEAGVALSNVQATGVHLAQGQEVPPFTVLP